MVFAYELLALSLPPTEMIDNVVRHNNKFSLTGLADDNGGPEPSQGDNYVSNMQWMVKEVIHKNNNEFLVTQLRSGIKIRAMSDISHHPTHQYGTSSWIIKIQKNGS